MKLRGSLACLLLTLCLGSGAASPLQSGGEGAGPSASQGMGDAISHGIGEAVGQGAEEAASSGIQDALGQGHGEEGSYALRGARGDAFDHGLGEAARSLGDAGHEVGRQAEGAIRRGIDAAHNSGSWGASGGHGMFGSQGGFGGHGNPGRQGTPWASEGNFGTNSLGGSVGQGGDGRSFNYEANGQGAVAQPGYGSVRGSNQNSGCTNPPPSGSRESSSGGSSSGGGSGGRDSSSGSSQGGSSGNSHGSSGHGGQGNGGQGSGGHGNGGHGSGGHGNGGQGSSGSSSSGSRDVETSNFDEGYSVSRGGSSGSRGVGGNKPECDNPGDDVRTSGGSRNQESRESSGLLGGPHDYQEHGFSGDGGRNEAVSGLKAVNSDPSSLPFNFDSFWENFKSKMGFINWDAINKDKGSSYKP
ncbi:dermokine [Mesocricetus auratus]|uniref:Dermokine n=1 Tax=Mesocricetus auratus TaxID=10036 RepID=A0A3Q0D9T6_MESAU|nr:dermokine [Mesocricetus auratus]